MTVDNIQTEEQWNAVLGLQGKVLQLAQGVDIADAIHATHLTCHELFHILIVSIHFLCRTKTCVTMQIQLSNLVLYAHLRHQVIDEAVHLSVTTATIGVTASQQCGTEHKS